MGFCSGLYVRRRTEHKHLQQPLLPHWPMADSDVCDNTKTGVNERDRHKPAHQLTSWVQMSTGLWNEQCGRGMCNFHIISLPQKFKTFIIPNNCHVDRQRRVTGGRVLHTRLRQSSLGLSQQINYANPTL